MIRSPRCLGLTIVMTAVLALGLPAGSSAQQVFGSIFGTVTDKSGAAVPNAKVTITDTNKDTKFEVTTNDAGEYNRGQLVPDTYKVEIEASGFRKVQSNEIAVNVNSASRYDAALEVGNVSESVEVTAAAPLLQADRADVATTLTTQQVANLPNFSRNVQSFELLSPGTSRVGWQHASSENPQGSVQIQVNGQQFSGTGFQLDGTDNQDPILGIVVINPTIDSVNQVQQASQVYDAEYGSVGAGVLVYSTKSGTNDLHGSAFEYLYNNTPGFQDFARNQFTEPKNAASVKWNQFGGSIGGALIKNKLFYFGDAQITRRRTGASVLTTVPTALARTGNLSEYGTPIYDPLTGNQTTGVGRTQFANNTIPTNRLSQQALGLLNYFPLPNTNTGSAFQKNYRTSGAEQFNSEQWDTRWDYFINEKNTMFGRFSYAGFDKFAPGAFGLLAGGPAFDNINFAGLSGALNQSIAYGWTHTFSGTVINELRVGYLRYRVNVDPNGEGTAPAAALGIRGVNLDSTFSSGLPYFDILGQSGDAEAKLGYSLGANQCNCPLREKEQQYQVVDNLTDTIGSHTLKFGADIRYALNLRVPSDNHRAGEFTFGNGYTAVVDANGQTAQGLGLATFLLGQPTEFKRYVSSSTSAAERQPRLFFYGQDTWRATPKLTINWGLRWEIIAPERVNRPGNGGQLDLATGLINVFGVGLIGDHGIQDYNWTNFAPRLGVAYQLTPKTVIRAGYGWSYNLGTFGSVFGHNVTQNLPVLAIQDVTSPTNFGSVFNLANGPNPPVFPAVSPQGTFPLPNGVTAKARPKTVVLPRVEAYNLTLEHQLTNKASASVGYVANQGRHVFTGTGQLIDVNTPAFIPGVSDTNSRRPFFSRYGWTQGIQLYCNCANDQYNSLQATLNVRNMAGYTVTANYTYQVAEGDGWGGAADYTFLYNRKLGYGNADYIARNQFTLLQNYSIPFGHGRKYGANLNKAVDLVLGGWEISGISAFYSGRPFTPSIGTYPSAYIRPNAGPSGRPDKGTGSVYGAGTRNKNRWYTPDTVVNGVITGPFAAPANNTFGNYAPNTLFGPSFYQQDVSLQKAFAITERFRFTLRTDAFNVFNHTNLDNPNNNVVDANAGRITGIAPQSLMRRLQFSGRIDF